MNTTNKTSFDIKSVWKTDMVSGFLICLLALPLSLGIAKASGFPASMGVLTAMIGGLVTPFFRVSSLTIKGPAAGLITIAAAAVIDLGGDTQGWKMACAAIVVMALIQVLFGFLRFGSFSAIFPYAAVHGMLVAIGVIIIAKQIPVLLGVDPELYKGQAPFELFANIPRFFSHASGHVSLIGAIGLLVMFGLSIVKINALKKVPSPAIVLLVALLLSLYFNLKDTEADYSLVVIGDFWADLTMNADFSAMGSFVFWKYVLLFLFVSSLESLLTVKAVDGIDPFKRRSNYNGDLVGQGLGNAISGFLGGLPMISEVVRSTSNVAYGAKSKWSNFFHGLFLLIAMALFIPVIELIPNSALAAMLIFAGYRLASPKHFIHAYKLGREQLAILITTLVVTLLEDLLLGILAGILVKMIFQLFLGLKFSAFVKTNIKVEEQNEGTYVVHIEDHAVFTNLIKTQKVLYAIPRQKSLTLFFHNCVLIDHTFAVFLDDFKRHYEEEGGTIQILGTNDMRSLSDHPLAGKVKKKA